MKTIKRNEVKKLKADPDFNVLASYLNEISRIPLLTREEEDLTARAAAQGDNAARDKLIKGNLRFVVNVAKKYQGMGLPLSDLISEGNIGLIKAAEKFDAERGFRFISYAVWWIRQTVLKAICDKSRHIRLPGNRVVDLINIEKAKRILSGDTGGDVEIQEISRMLDMDEDRVEEMIAISREIISLDMPVNTRRGASPLGHFVEDSRYIAPEQVALNKSLESDIENMLATLDDKEAEIIRCRYGLGESFPMTLDEIGERYDLCKERIRQLETNALRHLRQPSRVIKLEGYVA